MAGTIAGAAAPRWVELAADSPVFQAMHAACGTRYFDCANDVIDPPVTLGNPVVYLVSGFRWSFYGIADVSVAVSLGMTLAFLGVSTAVVAWIFRTGYRLKR